MTAHWAAGPELESQELSLSVESWIWDKHWKMLSAGAL